MMSLALRQKFRKLRFQMIADTSMRCAFESSPERWDQSDHQGDPTPLDQIRNDIAPLIKPETRSGVETRSKRQDESDVAAGDAIYQLLSNSLK